MNDYKWIESINTYFYIIEQINEHFYKMRRTFNHDEIEEESFFLCIEILRMIPFEGKEELQLIKKDGICLLRKNIPFLIEELNKILQKNGEILKKIKKIRNKYEHEPHNVNSVFSTGSGAYAGIGFYCNKDLVSINTMELTYIIYDLNILMNKIKQFVYEIQREHENEFDIFVKEAIEKIKIRKNIEYNSTYVRIYRWEDLDKKMDLSSLLL